MNKPVEISNTIIINIEVDKRLNSYSNKLLFPQKLERANMFIEKHGLPKEIKSLVKQRKEKKLTPVQKELLHVFAIEPTEEQMLQLKIFLSNLFSENLKKMKSKKPTQMFKVD
jgi:hypothetical protein